MIARLRPLFQRFFAVLTYLPRTGRLVGEAARGWTVAWVALLLLQGLLPALSVSLTRLLIDQLAALPATGRAWENMQPALFYAGLLAAALILAEVLRGLASLVRAAQAEKLQSYLINLIQQKSLAIDYAFYELAEYYDHLHRARSGAEQRPLALLENAGNLSQAAVTLTAMMLLLAPYGWWLPLVLLLSTLPALLLVFRHTLRHYEWQRRITEEQRRCWYYDWLMTTGEAAAEIRIFQLGDYLRQAYQQVRAKLNRAQWQLAKEQGLSELGAGLLAFLTTGAVLAWMGWRTLQGTATLGTLALFYQAFTQGQQLMRTALGQVGQLYSNGLFLSDLFEFLELQPQVVDPKHPLAPPRQLTTGVRFADVTFTYPGSARPVLRGFNLQIPAGQVAAIVGLNGAGKTTLIKLLCRLYDPDSGRIELDGVDLRALRLGDLRAMITVLFQAPVHYNETVRQNIQFGDLRRELGDTALQTALQSAGAAEVVEGLPQGAETMLGKWFARGAELSVGQWQRLSLARAFFKRAPLVLLDEPTSALDSWAENDWLKRFRAVLAGQTVLLITHRFTTAMQADVIHVLVGGEIVETGTHQELLAQNRLYAQSWREQTKEMI